MKHFGLTTLLITLVGMLTVCSCDNKNGGLYYMEVTVPTKNVMSFDMQNGGKDTIKVKNDSTLQICGIEIYATDKTGSGEYLYNANLFNDEQPTTLEKDGETFGTIVYDKDGSVNKITIAEYEISKVTDKEGTFRNEYAVYVKPSATTRKYRLIISVYCKTPEHEMKASPARITIE